LIIQTIYKISSGKSLILEIIDMPKVSVIMSAYNVEHYIRKAVKSILDQTFKDFELIVINDGSTDRTPEILKEYTDPRIKVLSQEHKGVFTAWNWGMRSAKGEYVAILDADDIALPARLHKQISFLDQNPEIGIVGSFCSVINEKTGRETLSPRATTDSAIRRSILLVNPFIHSTTVYRKKILDKVGLPKRKYNPFIIDYDLIIRILKESKGANLPEVLCVRNERPQSMTRGKKLSNHLKLIILIRMRAIRMLNIPFWRWYQIIIPITGALLYRLGVNKERGHQFISEKFIKH